MTKITVLTVTHRSWDMLYRQAGWLAEQTFTDFEWVIVDERYKQRPNFAREVKVGGFPIIHLPDKVSDPEYISNGAAPNYGLTYASGDLVFFMVDYVWPTPRVLERHYELQQRGGPAIVSGPLAWRSANDDASQPNQERQGDVQSDLDPHVWLVTDHYEKVRRFSWLGRNDSAPMEAILACNGFDDRLKGLRGGIDPLLSIQMVNWGCKYLIDTWPEAICYEFSHCHEVKRSTGPNHIWEGLFKTAYHEKLIRSPNAQDLRAARAANLQSSVKAG